MQGAITQTTELAVSILLSLALRGRDVAVTPREIAEDIGASPTYTAKVCGQLVKAHILRSQRGAQGGVILEKLPESLTLLDIVEACQGRILADYCREVSDLRKVCGYHLAMNELHKAVTGSLQRWTLRDLMRQPHPLLKPDTEGHCLISRTWVSALRSKDVA
jgi:Rrf2 family protein